MKRRAVCALLCLAPVAHARDAAPNWCGQPQAHVVDVRFARAIERSGGVTVDMRDAQGDAWDGWDAELNRLYRAVMQRLDGGNRATALRDAQRAWLAWDAAEAVSDNAMQADAGTSGPLAVADLAIERRRARACTLRRLLDDAAMVAD